METKLKTFTLQELPFCGDFEGKLIEEFGFGDPKPLSRFVDADDVLKIFVSDDEREKCIGIVKMMSGTAEICGDGNLYISGSDTRTFILYMSQ